MNITKTTARYLFAWMLLTLTLTASAQTSTMNYVRTREPRRSITRNGQLDTLSALNDSVMTTIAYIDGLGRPLQTVQFQASPTNKDVVQPMAYDAYGREPVKYLPYAVNTAAASDGSYKTTALTAGSGVAHFYNPSGTVPTTAVQQTNGIPVTADPFSVTSYEPSPLNRVVEQGAPGENFQPGGHTSKITYSTNDRIVFSPTMLVNNPGNHLVALYTAAANPDQSRTLSRYNDTACYNNGQLFLTISRDENWTATDGCVGTTEEYKDKEGHVILKRTYYINASKVAPLSTYYVYDDYGNLCFVLPPGSNPDNTVDISTTLLQQYCYQYRYDERNRMTQKYIPGKGWEFTVYNTLDQVVLTQDANQRNNTPQQFTFTKYDAQGRVIMNGISTLSSASADPNIFTPSTVSLANLASYYLTTTNPKWEARNNTTLTGYDGLSDPTGTSYTYLSINYYDNYLGIPGLPSVYDQHTNAAYSSMTTGLLTATKTYVLNTASDALWTVNYYDNYGMPICTYKQHYLGGTSSLSQYNYNVVTTTYNFNKQPLTVVTKHYTSNAGTSATLALTITDSYTYDQVGRKINSYQVLKSGSSPAQAKVLVARNVYNEVGQLKSKNLHSLSPYTTFLQTVNYRYTPRGWLSNINNATLANDGGYTSNETTDLFGEELYYDRPNKSVYNGSTTTGTNSTLLQYNGNISSVSMQSAAINGTTPAQLGYDFRYDRLNRVTNSVSLTSGVKTTNGQGYYDENVVYNTMGNITNMRRYDQTAPATRTLIDSLNYTYIGNQQSIINDFSGYTGPGGFNEQVQLTGEYKYDLNGNMTKDRNKGLTLTYNLLNLPATITLSPSNNTVVYVYSASGEKLRKVFTVGSNITTTEYIDGIEYDNGALAFEQTEEGRARNNGTGTYSFEYDLKDHLGDTRLTFTTANNTANVVQENSYYPFGASIASLYPAAPSPENHYLYNHKELQEETNLYDYGARFYDPVIGRWTSVDPFAEKSRRFTQYNYVENNPLRNIDLDGDSTTHPTVMGNGRGFPGLGVNMSKQMGNPNWQNVQENMDKIGDAATNVEMTGVATSLAGFPEVGGPVSVGASFVGTGADMISTAIDFGKGNVAKGTEKTIALVADAAVGHSIKTSTMREDTRLAVDATKAVVNKGVDLLINSKGLSASVKIPSASPVMQRDHIPNRLIPYDPTKRK